MEKDAAGFPSLPLHYGLTNPGIRRNLASRLPYEDEPRTQKPFVATLRVTKSRPAKLGQAAGSETCVVSGDRQDEA